MRVLQIDSIKSVLTAASTRVVFLAEDHDGQAGDKKSEHIGIRDKASIYLNPSAAQETMVATDLRHLLAIPVEVTDNISHTAFRFNNASMTSPVGCVTQEDSEDDSAQTSYSSADSEIPVHATLDPLLRQSAAGHAALDRFLQSILHVFDDQHRISTYAVYVWRRLARLCYFDCGGAIISEEFDWTTPDSPLHDFMWKVAHMKDTDLGYDPTVTAATDEEAKEFKDMAENPAVHEKIREFVKQATAPGQPIYKVEIVPMAAPPDEGFPDDPFPPPPSPDPSLPADVQHSPELPVAPKAQQFLIGKAHFSSNSLVGQCTRGYIAYDIVGHRLCFLMDSWRPYVPNRTRPEHLVLQRMARLGVTGIPTLICGGDVGGMQAQRSQAQNVIYCGGTKPPGIHYRMATVEIGLPLESFKNFKQLSLIFADAVYCESIYFVPLTELISGVSSLAGMA